MDQTQTTCHECNDIVFIGNEFNLIGFYDQNDKITVCETCFHEITTEDGAEDDWDEIDCDTKKYVRPVQPTVDLFKIFGKMFNPKNQI